MPATPGLVQHGRGGGRSCEAESVRCVTFYTRLSNGTGLAVDPVWKGGNEATVDHVTRVLKTFLIIAGLSCMAHTATAGTDEASLNILTSRSTHLHLADPAAAGPERQRLRDKRIRLRYDRPVQVGGNKLVLRLKAPLKTRKMLAFEVLF